MKPAPKSIGSLESSGWRLEIFRCQLGDLARSVLHRRFEYRDREETRCAVAHPIGGFGFPDDSTWQRIELLGGILTACLRKCKRNAIGRSRISNGSTRISARRPVTGRTCTMKRLSTASSIS